MSADNNYLDNQSGSTVKQANPLKSFLPLIVIVLGGIVSILLYKFVFGAAGNFEGNDPKNLPRPRPNVRLLPRRARPRLLLHHLAPKHRQRLEIAGSRDPAIFADLAKSAWRFALTKWTYFCQNAYLFWALHGGAGE